MSCGETEWMKEKIFMLFSRIIKSHLPEPFFPFNLSDQINDSSVVTKEMTEGNLMEENSWIACCVEKPWEILTHVLCMGGLWESVRCCQTSLSVTKGQWDWQWRDCTLFAGKDRRISTLITWLSLRLKTITKLFKVTSSRSFFILLTLCGLDTWFF